MKKEQEQDKLLDSAYDGIQEYDNALPRWWLWLFYATIIFAFGYVWYFHLGGPGVKLTEELAIDMQALEAQRAAAVKVVDTKASEGELAHALGDPARIQKAAVIFAEKCSPCHGTQAQGIIGPNLTDDFWIHGGAPVQIKKVIEEGVLQKGMVAWKGIIADDDILSLVAYVRSLKGSNPPNAKAAEGAAYTE